MARTALTVEVVDIDGAFRAEVDADVVNGNMFENDGGCFLVARNAHATLARNVTLVTPRTVGGLTVQDPVVAVPALSSRYIGPFPSTFFSQPSGADAGKVYVDGETTDIKFTVYRLP